MHGLFLLAGIGFGRFYYPTSEYNRPCIYIFLPDTTVEEYKKWNDSVVLTLGKLPFVSPYYIFTARNNSSYEEEVKKYFKTHTVGIAFFHLNNQDAIRIINENVPHAFPLVCFTGGRISSEERQKLMPYSCICLFSHINHYSECPWHLEDFLKDWRKQCAVEGCLPDFNILTDGISQMLLQKFRRLRDVILNPLVALSNHLKNEALSYEKYSEIMKDSQREKIHIDGHIKKASLTLRAITNGPNPSDEVFLPADLLRINQYVGNKEKLIDFVNKLDYSLSNLKLSDEILKEVLDKQNNEIKNAIIMQIEDIVRYYKTLIDVVKGEEIHT